VRSSPVRSFFTFTVAPATNALDASRTVPVKRPWSVCARAVPAHTLTSISVVANHFLAVIMPP
jgi:hypothetical protein